MIAKTMIKCGFIKDENGLQLKKVFKNNACFKEVHIDIYPDSPLNSATDFMLLLRTSEKNVLISNDGNRIILKKDDRCNTHLINVLFSKITECFYKAYDNYFELILNIQNIYYKITILN